MTDLNEQPGPVPQTPEPDQPPCSGPEASATASGRGPDGKLLPGHNIGQRWKKGCPSPNPTGRASAHHLTQRLKELLEANDGVLAEAFVRVFLEKALKGDHRFAIEVLNRMEGKVPDKVEDITPRMTPKQAAEELKRTYEQKRGIGKEGNAS